MNDHPPVSAEDLVGAVRRDLVSPDGDTRRSLRDDMFGTEPGQNERAIAFAKEMAQSTADHDRRVIEMSAQIAKVQAKTLVAACRTGDRELVKGAWAVVGTMDEAYNIALQLALSLAVLTEDVGPELDQHNYAFPICLTWDDILEESSRLHTTKTAQRYPEGPVREASRMIDVLVDGRAAQIVPTRMHEPGLYWRWRDGDTGPKRSDIDIEELKAYAEAGKVCRVG